MVKSTHNSDAAFDVFNFGKDAMREFDSGSIKVDGAQGKIVITIMKAEEHGLITGLNGFPGNLAWRYQQMLFAQAKNAAAKRKLVGVWDVAFLTKFCGKAEETLTNVHKDMLRKCLKAAILLSGVANSVIKEGEAKPCGFIATEGAEACSISDKGNLVIPSVYLYSAGAYAGLDSALKGLAVVPTSWSMLKLIKHATKQIGLVKTPEKTEIIPVDPAAAIKEAMATLSIVEEGETEGLDAETLEKVQELKLLTLKATATYLSSLQSGEKGLSKEIIDLVELVYNSANAAMDAIHYKEEPEATPAPKKKKAA